MAEGRGLIARMSSQGTPRLFAAGVADRSRSASTDIDAFRATVVAAARGKSIVFFLELSAV